MKTIAQLASLALAVQDACNLSGVVHSFAQTMTDLREIARAEGWEGTDALNRHPISLLFSSKIASLTYSESSTEFSKAYEWATGAAAGRSVDPRGPEGQPYASQGARHA